MNSKRLWIVSGLLAASVAVACNDDDDNNERMPTTLPEPMLDVAFGGATSTDGATAFRASCSSDTFFVDLSLGLPESGFVPQAGATPWNEQVGEGLSTRANAEGNDWFTESCAGPITVEASLVLKPRAATGIGLRDNAHWRFGEFRFICSATNEALKVKDERYCHLIDQVRTLVSDVTDRVPNSDETFFVGRTCFATSAGFESNPTDAMIDWHYPSLGMPSGPNATGPSEAELFILDGGTDAALIEPLDVRSNTSYVTATGARRNPHRHGSAMAIYARQIAPNVRLYTPQVIDGTGRAAGADIVRAFDDVLFEPERFGVVSTTSPLIVNFSLGFTAGLADRSGVSGTHPDGSACLTYEDPYGEALRFMFWLAAAVDDDASSRRVFVVAAAGNKSGDPTAGPNVAPSSQPFTPVPTFSDNLAAPRELNLDCFGSSSATGGPWFFPGFLSRKPTCEFFFVGGQSTGAIAGSRGTLLGIAVSAIRGDDRPADNALEPEAPLVAVGQHVIAQPPAEVMTPRQQCAPSPQFPPDVRLPAALSGSSISSVFVAAAAAHTQATLTQDPLREPLRQFALAQLLYAAGRPLCRETFFDLEVRALDMQRIDTALACSTWNQLMGCFASSDTEPFVGLAGLETRASCDTALPSCGLVVPGTTTTCSPPSAGPPPATFDSDQVQAACPTITATPALIEESDCAQMASCTEALGFDRHFVSASGPLPIVGGCPWCGAIIIDDGSNGVLIELLFELNPDLPDGTYFYFPQLVITIVENGSSKTRWFDLVGTGLTNESDWEPGNTIQMAGYIELDYPGPDAEITGELHTIVQSPEGDGPAVDVSALIVTVQ